jgi:hypothetical protein
MGNGFNLKLPTKTYLGADWNRKKYKKTNLFTELDYALNDHWNFNSKLNYVHAASDEQFAFISNTGGKFTGVEKSGELNGTTENIQRYKNHGNNIAWQNNLTGKFNAFGQQHDLFFTHSSSREKSNSRNVWKDRAAHPYNIYTFDWKTLTKPDWENNNKDYTDTGHAITTHAFSAGARINPTEQLHILAAARFTYWHYDSENHKTGKDSKYSKNMLVPYFGITYDLTPKHSLYASYTTIDKPQTVRDMNNHLLKPITGTNYEIGWKADWFGNGELNSALSIFRIEQKNRPFDLETRNSAGEWTYLAQGKIRSQGIDAEISGNLTPDWKLFAGYTYNTSKYLKNEGSRYPSGTNFSKHTPKHLARLYSSYNLPYNDHKRTISGGVRAQSETNSLWNVGQGGYALWDLGVKYDATKDLSISLVGSNLTDKRYYENHRVRTMGINNIYGEPRNVMLKFDWKLQ